MKTLLDTDVIAAYMRQDPDLLVVEWMESQPRSSLFISATTVDEIRFGIELMPVGRRRDRLERGFSRVILKFQDRVLPFDVDAAVASAVFRARRRKMGRPMGVADSHIAGVAKSKNLQLATLNTRDFEEIGLDVVHPH